MTKGRFVLGAVAAGLALVLAALPVTPDLGTFEIDTTSALAKNGNGNGGGNGNAGGNGNSNGNGNGNGGGNGNANAGGNGNGGGKGGHGQDSHQATGKAEKTRGQAAAKADKSRGRAAEKADRSSDRDKNVDAVSGVGRGKDKSAKKNGLSASSLGRLNAAHASARARERAAPHSAVGLLGQYEEAVKSEDIEAAAEALAAAANKDIDPAVVGAVNDLLGLEVDPETEQEIADLASDLQDDDGNNGLGHGNGGSSPDDDEDGHGEDGEEIE